MQLCDFGLARMVDINNHEDNEINLSNEVVTKCYRPPEIFLGNAIYSEKVDIWSLGCVIVELFTKKILFSGQASKDILESIIRSVRDLTKNDLIFIDDEDARQYVDSVPRDSKGELVHLLSGTIATSEGIDIFH